MASYNTMELTALLIWSLHRILRWDALDIVIVDNGSTDGSALMLADLNAAGICHVMVNAANRHVAALRRLVDALEAAQVDAARRCGWYWHEIAVELGVTKQAVHQKHGGRDVEPGPRKDA
ncbi:MAG: glycosyltransferase family 2 protein [Acidimicrobiales bacterium]